MIAEPRQERNMDWKSHLDQLNINRSRWRDYLRVSHRTCINHKHRLRKISPLTPLRSTTLWTDSLIQMSIQTSSQDECQTMTYTRQLRTKNKWTHCLRRKWLCKEVQPIRLRCRKPPWNFTNFRWYCIVRWQSRPTQQLVKDRLVLIRRKSHSSQMPNWKISTIK